MKTRVVRYWGGTDWLYKVDVFRDISPAEIARNAEILASQKRNDARVPGSRIYAEKTAYYPLTLPGLSWRFERHGCSRDRAMSVASRLAENLPQEDCDVIAEFGS
jgi:hypothetical protein